MKYLKSLALLLILNTNYAFAFPKAPIDNLNFQPHNHFAPESFYDFKGRDCETF